jgi:SAM-dependent methyltransferase
MVVPDEIHESSTVSSTLHDDIKENRGLGAYIYNSWVLNIYDIWVLGLSNSFAWHCPTSSILLPFFKDNFSSNHLDIGVGTGYYLAEAVLDRPPTSKDNDNYKTQHITLVDLNPNCLSTAAARINAAQPTLAPARTVVADVFESLPLTSINGCVKDERTGKEKFDSISLFYLLHCVPGPCSSKARIFENLKTHLTEDGTLYGATILGQGENIRFNWFASTLMGLYNKKGIFGNSGDTEKLFIEALKRNFEKVESRVEGCVLLFKASKPIL